MKIRRIISILTIFLFLTQSNLPLHNNSEDDSHLQSLFFSGLIARPKNNGNYLFTWKDAPDNWVPVNKGLPENFEFKDLVVFNNEYYLGIRADGDRGGLYKFDTKSEVWTKVGPPGTRYGMNRLYVSGNGANQRLFTFREDLVQVWTGSKWRDLPRAPERLAEIAVHTNVNNRFFAYSSRNNKLRLFEFNFTGPSSGSWTERRANGLVHVNSQHSNLVLSGDGNLFFTYTWRGRDAGNKGTKSNPSYINTIYRSTDNGNTFSDVTRNPDNSRGIHLGNMTDGITPGPFGSLRSVTTGSITEEFAVTEQGVFVRNFNKGGNNQGTWQQVFRYWGHRGLSATQNGSRLILSQGSSGVDIWDNESSLGSMRRLTRMSIGQDSTYACRWNRIRNIQSADSRKYIAFLTVGNRNCDRDKNIQIGMVRLNIDPDKPKSSYNLDLNFAGYHRGGGTKISRGLVSLSGGRFALFFNHNGKGVIEIRNNFGQKVQKTINLTGPIHDGKSPGEHKEFVVTGDFGTHVYNADGDLVRDLGVKGNRVSMNRKGRVGLVQTVSDSRHRIYSFAPNGKLESQHTVRRNYVEDIAVSNTEDLIAIAGFDNKRRKGVPVQVAYVTGHRPNNLSQQVFQTWSHGGEEMGNDMADTRIYRMTFGDNGKLYVMGETAGGNTVFRWNGKDFQTPTLVSYDLYNDGFQTKDEHKMYYGIVNTRNGRIERGQMTFTRTSSYRGNTFKAEGGSIYVDSRGVVYIGAGTTAFSIEGRDLRKFNQGTTGVGTYSDGDTSVLIVSPDFRERIVWTVFARPGAGGTGPNVPGGGRVSGIAINGGKVGILASARQNGRLIAYNFTGAGLSENPPGGASGKDPDNLYFAVFDRP